MSFRNPVCCLHNRARQGEKVSFFLSSIFTGANCQRALNAFVHVVFFFLIVFPESIRRDCHNNGNSVYITTPYYSYVSF